MRPSRWSSSHLGLSSSTRSSHRCPVRPDCHKGYVDSQTISLLVGPCWHYRSLRISAYRLGSCTTRIHLSTLQNPRHRRLLFARSVTADALRVLDWLPRDVLSIRESASPADLRAHLGIPH